MEYIIIDEPHEKLVVKPGDNETVVLLHKRRSSRAFDWERECTILNRREALLINQAISQILLEPKRYRTITEGPELLKALLAGYNNPTGGE